MEIAIVLIIALIVLGPKKLPEAGRSLGKGLREFKDTVSGMTGGDHDDDAQPRQVAARAADDGSGVASRADAVDPRAAAAAPAPERESVS